MKKTTSLLVFFCLSFLLAQMTLCIALHCSVPRHQAMPIFSATLADATARTASAALRQWQQR
ncbi:hypothetical protein DEG00_018625 [Xanthomonas vasicola]|nr:hypothetical protein DEG00_018625 [Xanthomonas vasicola]